MKSNLSYVTFVWWNGTAVSLIDQKLLSLSIINMSLCYQKAYIFPLGYITNCIFISYLVGSSYFDTKH